MKRILEEIIDRNTGGNYLLSSSDKTQMISEILDLLGVMPRFNLNHEVIIYPNERGFAKIKALIGNRYLLSNEEAETWVNKRKTEDGGYKEQLWVIVSDLHDMFYNGQSYMATTWIALLNEA